MSGNFEIHCVTDSVGIPIHLLGKIAKSLPDGATMDGSCEEPHGIDGGGTARCVVRFRWEDQR